MILTTILLGATLITGVGLLAKFWNEITDWLKRAINKVKEIIGTISYGVRVFIKKVKEGIQEISKHFHKNGTQWNETIVTRTISESEVPEEIRAKANYYSETDISNELEMQLA